jgi:hypothetical protein
MMDMAASILWSACCELDVDVAVVVAELDG